MNTATDTYGLIFNKKLLATHIFGIRILSFFKPTIMKNRSLIILILLAVIFNANTCDDGTRIRFAKTLNLLEIITPAYTPSTGRFITGFSLPDHTGEPTLVRRIFSTGNTQFAIPGAGTETPPCNDGTPLTRATNAPTAPLVRIVSLIGDTGGDDVSDDSDCRCDTHIQRLELANIIIHYADGIQSSLGNRTIQGRYFLCPNIPEGHLVTGDRENLVDLWLQHFL